MPSSPTTINAASVDLMRAAGLHGVQARRFITTTVGDPTADRARDQVEVHRRGAGPPLGGRHYLYPAWAGFLYLAIVLDVARRVVGWAMETHSYSALVALAQRRPDAVIHHSDPARSYAFGKRCQEAGVMQVGSTGMRTITPWRRVSSPRSTSTVDDFFRPKPGWPSSSGSRAGTHRRHSALGYRNYERRQLAASARPYPSSRGKLPAFPDSAMSV